MKILHLIPYYVRANKTGGPAVQLSHLAEALYALGCEVVIVTSTGNLDEEINLEFDGDIYETQEWGIPTIYFRRKITFCPATYYYAPALSGWLRVNVDRFDILVIHGPWTYFGWIGARICQQNNKPYVFFVHGGFDPWALNHHRLKKVPYWHLIEKHNFNKANGVIVLSRDEAIQVQSLGIWKPTFLARNGLHLPVPRLANPDGVLAHLCPELGNRPFVFFMSRLHPKKGLEVLLNAWSRIHTKHTDWRLVIAGPDEGGYLTILRGIVVRLGLSGSVIFPGFVMGDAKAALLQKSSVFVLTSYSEGVPGAVIEALAYGLPVLITPGCHIPEVVDAQAGLIVEPQPQTVASGLEYLITDARLRQQMGQNAEQLACADFDEMKVAEGLLGFLQGICSTARN